MPLTGRTTVTLDLKGCLEEVSRIAAGAGTQPQQHDHQKEPASLRHPGAGRSKTLPSPGQSRTNQKITAATAPEKHNKPLDPAIDKPIDKGALQSSRLVKPTLNHS
jgi:hypothetical protein